MTKLWIRHTLTACALALGLTAGAAQAETTYKVGSTPTGVPFTFLDIKTNEIDGMMVELIEAVGKEAGFAVQVEATPFSALIPSLTNEKIDIISAAMLITPERQEKIDFSQPVFPYGEGVVVPASDTTAYDSLDDFKGEPVGVQVGTVYADRLRDAGFADLKVYDSLADILRDVNLGRIKAGFGDKPIMAYQISQGKYPEVRLVDTYPSQWEGSIGIGVRKGNDELLGKINDALAKLKESGEIDRLAEKWGVK